MLGNFKNLCPCPRMIKHLVSNCRLTKKKKLMLNNPRADSQYYRPVPDSHSISESIMGEQIFAVSEPMTDWVPFRQLVMEYHPGDALQCADDAVLFRTYQHSRNLW